MSSSFLRGAGYVLTGLRWLPRAGVRGLVALPLAISTVPVSYTHLDVYKRQPSTPLIASSSGVATVSAITFGLAPG